MRYALCAAFLITGCTPPAGPAVSRVPVAVADVVRTGCAETGLTEADLEEAIAVVKSDRDGGATKQEVLQPALDSCGGDERSVLACEACLVAIVDWVYGDAP